MSLFIGHDIINLATVDSTNSYATNMLKDISVSEGTIVRAEEQTKGRGQRGNTWISEAGQNLTFSVILFPRFLPVNEQFYLTRAIACAVADFLSEMLNLDHHPEQKNEQIINIKWPNDILVDGKKIAGILIENSLRGDALVSTVAGIGLNVNQSEFPELENATSLNILLKRRFDIKNLLNSLCSFIEARYIQLRHLKYEKLEKDFMSRLYLLNQWHQFVTDKPLTGKIKNVSREGKLILETEHGEEKNFGFKEISFFNKPDS